MNNKFKALIKASGNNHLTNYILTSYNEPQTTNHEPRIMQNKPNFQKAQLSVTSFLTTDYDDFVALRLPKNKAKQTQFKNFIYRKTAKTRHKCLPVALFSLTSSRVRDYNGIFSKMSYLERTPNERVRK